MLNAGTEARAAPLRPPAKSIAIKQGAPTILIFSVSPIHVNIAAIYECAAPTLITSSAGGHHYALSEPRIDMDVLSHFTRGKKKSPLGRLSNFPGRNRGQNLLSFRHADSSDRKRPVSCLRDRIGRWGLMQKDIFQIAPGLKAAFAYVATILALAWFLVQSDLSVWIAAQHRGGRIGYLSEFVKAKRDLGGTPSKEVTDHLEKLARDGSPCERYHALYALGRPSDLTIDACRSQSPEDAASAAQKPLR